MIAPNTYYEKFFEKFVEIENTDVKNWSKTGVLAYFCKKYKEHYNADYQFKFNTPQPSKCFEVFQINKLYINLSSDPINLKTYIDWVFENRVKKAKRKLTSISFLTNEQTLREFKNKYFSNKIVSTIDRSSNLPEELVSKIKHINENILTYGDLAFIMQSKNAQSELIEKLNLDLSFLDRIV
jgi:hypothetical protein